MHTFAFVDDLYQQFYHQWFEGQTPVGSWLCKVKRDQLKLSYRGWNKNCQCSRNAPSAAQKQGVFWYR